MFKACFFTAGIVFAGLALSSAAAIAQQLPMSAAHQQATLANDPAACGKAVDKAADSIFLRIQGDDGKNGRAQATAFLQTAQDAAKHGNEQSCWYWYDRAQNRP